jgi:hypothetical protein
MYDQRCRLVEKIGRCTRVQQAVTVVSVRTKQGEMQQPNGIRHLGK